MSTSFELLSHEEKSAALLDYVKGRATRDLAEQISMAMQTDETVAEEIAYYRGLSDALGKPETPGTFDEVGWARLSKAIHQERAENSRPEAANDTIRFWQYIAASLLVVAAAQTVFIAGRSPEDTPATYETVSEVTTGYQLQVTFSPDATEENIRTLLRNTGAEITSGPSAIGLYTLSFEDEATLKGALPVFEANQNIVESVYQR